MFRRQAAKDPTSAIGEFWRWWETAEQRVADAIEAGTVASLAGEIAGRVATIHTDLQWELAAGSAAQHALVVAPAGDAKLRALAARWLAAAPPADAVFEYHASRQPDDAVFSSRMQLAGHELELSELRFAFVTDDDGHELDVSVYHPEFSEMTEDARLQVTFLALDWALGEDQVELWVGRVETQFPFTPNLRSPAELRAAVAELAARHAQRAALLSGQTRRGRPMMAVIEVPLKPARWPRFDTHVAVTLRFPARDTGLPTDESLTRLREAEDRISAILANDGAVVAHETADGVRTLHVYVDGAGKAKAVAGEVGRATSLKSTVKITYDPALEQVRHLRP